MCGLALSPGHSQFFNEHGIVTACIIEKLGVVWPGDEAKCGLYYYIPGLATFNYVAIYKIMCLQAIYTWLREGPPIELHTDV